MLNDQEAEALLTKNHKSPEALTIFAGAREAIKEAYQRGRSSAIQEAQAAALLADQDYQGPLV